MVQFSTDANKCLRVRIPIAYMGLFYIIGLLWEVDSMRVDQHDSNVPTRH